MHDIFVSYAAEDRERVVPLVERLEAEGWSVWSDRQIAPGATFDREIEQALAEARSVVVVWSSSSVNSDWVRTEAHEGLDRDILVPLRIDDVIPPLAFRRKQTIDLLNMNDEALDPVVAGVRRLLVTSLEFGLEPDPTPEPSGKSIAILAFEDLSSSKEYEYLGDSIAEALMSALAQIPDLRVAARIDAFHFKGSGTGTRDIGRALNVKHVLEGTVRVAGNRLRITAQLIDVASGYHEWSNDYDGTLDDIFDVQDDVSLRVAEAMKVVLNPEEHERMLGVGTTSVDAYLAFAQTVVGANPNTFFEWGAPPLYLRRNLEFCDEALRHDPDFVAAYARKLTMLSLLSAKGELALATVREEQRLLRERVQQIQRTGRRQASPYDMASMNFETWRWPELESVLHEMIESGRYEQPDPLGRGWPIADYAHLLLVSGAYRTGIGYYEEAIERAPSLRRNLSHYLAMCHMGLGELERTVEIVAPLVDRALAAGATPWGPHRLITLCHIFLDDFESADQRIRELRSIGQEARVPYYETLVLIRKGGATAAQAKLDAFEQEAPPQRFNLGLINHMLGHHERGYEWWVPGMREHESNLSHLRMLVEGLIPELARTGDDYQKMLEIGGLDDTWKHELLERAAKLTSITGIEVQD